MADTPTSPVDPTEHIGPSNTTRKNICISTLVFCFSIIVFIIGWGDAANSLHSSALAWAFAMSGAVIGAFVFGVAWDNMTFTKK